jgi:hypothetical protein
MRYFLECYAVESIGKRWAPNGWRVQVMQPLVEQTRTTLFGGMGYFRGYINSLAKTRHLWVNVDNLRSELLTLYTSGDAREVYISLPFSWEYEKIRGVLRAEGKHIKHIIGGAGAKFLSQEEMPSNVTVFTGFGEDLFKLPFSGTYKTDLPKVDGPYHLSVAVSYGCYWNRCLFCEGYDSKKIVRRKNIVDNLASLPLGPEDWLDTSSPALFPREVEAICEARQHSDIGCFTFFLRADRGAIKRFEKFDDLTGVYVKLGVEVYGQRLVDSLQKGYRVETTPELVRVLAERGAVVNLNTLSQLHDLTSDDLRAERETLLQLAPYYENIGWYHSDLTWYDVSTRVLLPPPGATFRHVDMGEGTTNGYWELDPEAPENKDLLELNQDRLEQIVEILGPMRFLDGRRGRPNFLV